MRANYTGRVTAKTGGPQSFWMTWLSNWSNNGPTWAHHASNHMYLDDVEIFDDTSAGQAATGSMADNTVQAK